MNEKELKTLKDLHVRMSWILLEYNVIYFSKSDFANKFNIHKSWYNLRDIHDHEYDKKWYLFLELSNVLGFDFLNEVSFNPERPSVKIIISNMQTEVKIPIMWPSDIDQIYIHYLLLKKYSMKDKLKKVS